MFVGSCKHTFLVTGTDTCNGERSREEAGMEQLALFNEPMNSACTVLRIGLVPNHWRSLLKTEVYVHLLKGAASGGGSAGDGKETFLFKESKKRVFDLHSCYKRK